MTSEIISSLSSAHEFLFGDNSVTELGKRLVDQGALQEAQDRVGAVGQSVFTAAHKELSAMAAEFLDLDLASAAVAGWRKHTELLKAARQTCSTPVSVVVPLGTRDISLTQHPRIDLIFGEVLLTAIQFELRIDIKVVGVAGVVRDGGLVAFEGGHCDLTVAFSAAGIRLGERTASFTPHRAIPLGRGIRLIPRESCQDRNAA